MFGYAVAGKVGLWQIQGMQDIQTIRELVIHIHREAAKDRKGRYWVFEAFVPCWPLVNEARALGYVDWDLNGDWTGDYHGFYVTTAGRQEFGLPEIAPRGLPVIGLLQSIFGAGSKARNG